jgi:hypothetical protein
VNYITLLELKAQCAIDPSDDTHDDRLERLGTAAETWAENYLNAPLSDYEDSPATSPPTIPEDMKSALLLHAEWEFDRDQWGAPWVDQGSLLLKRAEQLLWPYRVVGL